jgi:hypothetical protein
MRLLTLATLFALSACATVPEPRIVTKEVKVPVAVRCVDPASVPAEPATVAMPTDARQAADTAASQAQLLRKWGRELYALIVPSCTR